MGDRSRSGSHFNDIPSCLMIDIFLRLPLKSLLSTRFVCKTWFLLFSDPLFVELLRARQPTCIILRTVDERKPLLLQLGDGDMGGGAENSEVDPMELVPGIHLPNCSVSFINSCQGLLCLQDWSDDKFKRIVYVCNPIIGEYITIPIVSSEARFGLQCALGFRSITNHFKVIQIYHTKERSGKVLQAEIYTVGNGTRQWRSVGIPPSYPYSGFNTFLIGGLIHWAASGTHGTHKFYYFDFEREQFGSLPSPFQANRQVKLGVLDGCLCASLTRPANLDELEIWVLRNESWTKMFSINHPHFPLDFHLYYHELLCLLNSQKILIWQHKRGVVCYDGEINKILDTDVIKDKVACLEIKYIPSVVSLRDVARGERFTSALRTMNRMG